MQRGEWFVRIQDQYEVAAVIKEMSNPASVLQTIYLFVVCLAAAALH